MEKRLVKTAKQQFEERLNALYVFKKWELCPTEIYYHCITSDEQFILLREQDGGYRELRYTPRYEDLILGERFLSTMSERLASHGLEVKPLFDWYASADHDNEPFNLMDIYMCDLEDDMVVFEDAYEEVPEVKTVSALEQWEKASANAKLAQQTEGNVYKVEVTDEAIVFYTCRNGYYSKELYPPFSELRKDGEFVTNYISFVRDSHPDDMEAALEWLAGREYTMSEVTLLDIYDVADCKQAISYVEKEVMEVAKQDFKEDMEDLQKKMVAHIKQLCDQGMIVNLEVLCQNRSIGWDDGSFEGTDDIKDFFLSRSISSDDWIYFYKDSHGEYSGLLSDMNIETLYNIIQSMQ